MNAVTIAIKPKYPTRKLVEKTIIRDNDFLEIRDIEASMQVNDLLLTSIVAIVYEDEYYPIDHSNYLEQFELIANGEAPTVDADDNFGYKNIYCFMSVPEETDGIENVQHDVELYNGLSYGTLYKVIDYSSLDIDGIDKNGYWMVFNFDTERAEAEGYSDIKFQIPGFEAVDAAETNYVHFGNNYSKAIGYDFIMLATFTATVGEVTETCEIIKQVICKYKLVNLHSTSDEVPAITADGVKVDSLSEAFSVVKKGGWIQVNKSFTDEEVTNGTISVEDINASIRFSNGATITTPNTIELSTGELILVGTGGITNTSGSSAIKIINIDEEKTAELYVGTGIVITSHTGIDIDKDSCNTIIEVDGEINAIPSNEDTEEPVIGINIRGTSNIDALIRGAKITSEGHGVYVNSEDVSVKITSSNITGNECGVEIRSGDIGIESSTISTITTESEEASITADDEKPTAHAVALAVSELSDPIQTSVYISSGTFKGVAAFIEGNAAANEEEEPATEIYIGGGDFIGEVKTLNPENDCIKFINSGKFTVRPDDRYIADGHHFSKFGKVFIVKKDTEDDRFFKSLGLEKLKEYQWKASYNEPLDYDRLEEFIDKYYAANIENYKYKNNFGLCSSVQVGNIRGRTYDWNYSHDINLFITTPSDPSKGRHMVVAECDAMINQKYLEESCEYSDKFRLAPFCVIDGMNDAGLIYNLNILPAGDMPLTTGTNPKSSTNVFNIMLGRYILENCTSVEDVKAYLPTLNIYATEYFGEMHFMVSDIERNVCVIEIINNEITYLDGQQFMTNYYMTIDKTPHSEGIERAAILEAGIEELEEPTDNDILELMKTVWYTNAFKEETDPVWYSEFNGKSEEFGDLTIDSNPEDYAEIIAYTRDLYEHRSRDTRLTWYSMHTCVYNSTNMTVTIVPCETESDKIQMDIVI